MEPEFANLRNKIKRELADFLGVGIEDVDDDSSFKEDFHMNASDMTDFLDILEKSGVETENINLTEIETFEELVEYINDKH